jgi:hypothetical protein
VGDELFTNWYFLLDFLYKGIYIYIMKKVIKRISIATTEEENNLITKFCKENCINMSSMTIKMWKDFIKNYERKN